MKEEKTQLKEKNNDNSKKRKEHPEYDNRIDGSEPKKLRKNATETKYLAGLTELVKNLPDVSKEKSDVSDQYNERFEEFAKMPSTFCYLLKNFKPVQNNSVSSTPSTPSTPLTPLTPLTPSTPSALPSSPGPTGFFSSNASDWFCIGPYNDENENEFINSLLNKECF